MEERKKANWETLNLRMQEGRKEDWRQIVNRT